MLGPFAHGLSLIVAIPEATIKDGGEPFVPFVFLLFGKRPVENAGNGLLVTSNHGINIFWSACPSFYLEHPHACIHHLVDEANRFQVFGTHDVFVINFQLCTRLVVGNGVRTAAELHALAAVSRPICVV